MPNGNVIKNAYEYFFAIDKIFHSRIDTINHKRFLKMEMNNVVDCYYLRWRVGVFPFCPNRLSFLSFNHNQTIFFLYTNFNDKESQPIFMMKKTLVVIFYIVITFTE